MSDKITPAQFKAMKWLSASSEHPALGDVRSIIIEANAPSQATCEALVKRNCAMRIALGRYALTLVGRERLAEYRDNVKGAKL